MVVVVVEALRHPLRLAHPQCLHRPMAATRRKQSLRPGHVVLGIFAVLKRRGSQQVRSGQLLHVCHPSHTLHGLCAVGLVFAIAADGVHVLLVVCVARCPDRKRCEPQTATPCSVLLLRPSLVRLQRLYASFAIMRDRNQQLVGATLPAPAVGGCFSA